MRQAGRPQPPPKKIKTASRKALDGSEPRLTRIMTLDAKVFVLYLCILLESARVHLPVLRLVAARLLAFVCAAIACAFQSRRNLTHNSLSEGKAHGSRVKEVYRPEI